MPGKGKGEWNAAAATPSGWRGSSHTLGSSYTRETPVTDAWSATSGSSYHACKRRGECA